MTVIEMLVLFYMQVYFYCIFHCDISFGMGLLYSFNILFCDTVGLGVVPAECVVDYTGGLLKKCYCGIPFAAIVFILVSILSFFQYHSVALSSTKPSIHFFSLL